MTNITSTSSAIGIGFCFPILGGIFVFLRFYSRKHQKVELQVDDWLTIPAWFCVTGCCASLLTCAFKHVFVDTLFTGPGEVTEQQRLLANITSALVIFWFFANVLIKLAILFFYRRIFRGQVFNILNWTIIGLSGVSFVYNFCSWILFCGSHVYANFHGGWLVCEPWGFDMQMAVYTLDTVTDACVIVLPIPFVWKLRLSIKRKIAVSFIFIIGGLSFVASLINSIVQIIWLTTPARTSSGPGFFQGSSLLFYLQAIEVGVGLVACNLPSLSAGAVHALSKTLGINLEFSSVGLRTVISRLSTRHKSEVSLRTSHSETTMKVKDLDASRRDVNNVKGVYEAREDASSDDRTLHEEIVDEEMAARRYQGSNQFMI